MPFWEKFKPSFGETTEVAPGTSRHLFNYRRIWEVVVLLTGVVSILPLIFITVVYNVAMQRSIASEFTLRTAQVVSNTQRSVSFFLSERRSALDFIVHDNSFFILNDSERLSAVLEKLKRSFGGGFVDLGLFDASGFERMYVGPYGFQDKNYSDQEWFKQVIDSGVYISDVFLGFRNIPHLVIAVKGEMANGDFYILRAALSIAPFENLLMNLELAGEGDAFMINNHGILQTPSRNHGKVLDKLLLPVPPHSPKTKVYEQKSHTGENLLIGARFIDESPFILMVVKKKNELMKPWYTTRMKLIAFLLISVTIILAVILGTATYMVKRMRIADERRVFTLHQVEYSNKMASIGRMAASVAHEINNPLAIINEKAGLIEDLFTLKGQYTRDEKLLGCVSSIINSVKRAGAITRRLLNFSRNLDASIENIQLKQVLDEVLSFMGKEAEIRCLDIRVEVPETIPEFEGDRGKLQQIFLNLINNALSSLDDGGHLYITAQPADPDFIAVTFADNGCGIPEENIGRIFEPFFSTKTGQGGTGLGLSITYNLIQEIGGKINVQSELGKGTSFIVHIPLKMKKIDTGDNHASAAC